LRWNDLTEEGREKVENGKWKVRRSHVDVRDTIRNEMSVL